MAQADRPATTRCWSSPDRASGSRSSITDATLRPRQGDVGRATAATAGAPAATCRTGSGPKAKQSVLVVLQGIDAAGKDGTISKVMEAFNPQGCPVSSFKVPTAEELAHDFLWRVHKRDAGQGRDRHLQPLALRGRARRPGPRPRARRRSGRSATTRSTPSSGRSPTSGTTIVKFFLSIDRDEQRERFQARYDDPTKRWKFSMGDLEERKLWDDYQAAFDDALIEDVDGRGRRGTSSRPTATGSATSRSSTILADTHRRPEAGLPGAGRTCRRTSSSSSRGPSMPGRRAGPRAPSASPRSSRRSRPSDPLRDPSPRAPTPASGRCSRDPARAPRPAAASSAARPRPTPRDRRSRSGSKTGSSSCRPVLLRDRIERDVERGERVADHRCRPSRRSGRRPARP